MSTKKLERMAAMANVKAGRLKIRVHSCAFVVLTDSTLGSALDIWHSSASRRFFAAFKIAAQPFHPAQKYWRGAIRSTSSASHTKSARA